MGVNTVRTHLLLKDEAWAARHHFVVPRNDTPTEDKALGECAATAMDQYGRNEVKP